MERVDSGLGWEVLTPTSSTNSIASPSSPYVVVRPPLSEEPRGPMGRVQSPIPGDPVALRALQTEPKQHTLVQSLLQRQASQVEQLEESEGHSAGTAVTYEQQEITLPRTTSCHDQPEDDPCDPPVTTPIKQEEEKAHAPDSPRLLTWKLVLSWPFMLPLVLGTLAVAIAFSQLRAGTPVSPGARQDTPRSSSAADPTGAQAVC